MFDGTLKTPLLSHRTVLVGIYPQVRKTTTEINLTLPNSWLLKIR